MWMAYEVIVNYILFLKIKPEDVILKVILIDNSHFIPYVNLCLTCYGLTESQTISIIGSKYQQYQFLRDRLRYLSLTIIYISLIDKQQMQRTSSISLVMNPCRPLVASIYNPPTQQGQQKSARKCIKLPYSYLLKDIKNLQPYLCPSVQIIGVDFETKPQNIPRLNYKNIMVGGSTSLQGQKLQIRSIDQFQVFSWKVDLVIPLPNTPKQNYQIIKKYLLSRIIIIKSKQIIEVLNSQQVLYDELKSAKISCLVSCSRKQSLLNCKCKLFMNTIPVQILLPRQQKYIRNSIVQMIAEDLARSVNLMAYNSLSYRVVQRHQNRIPINNFYSTPDQKDPNFDQLFVKGPIIEDQLLQSEKKNISNKSVTVQKNNAKKNMGQLYILIAVLVLIISGYIFIKLG